MDIALLNVRLSYLVVIKITFEFGIYNRALSTGLQSIQRFRARGLCLGECLIITGMVKKGKRVGSEPYIILNGAPAKLSGAGGMPWKVSALS